MNQGKRAGVGLLMLAGGLSACVHTGTIAGRMGTPKGLPAAVIFDYRSERFGEGGKISVALPNGEEFKGKYVQVTSTTTADVVEPVFYGPVWAPWGDPWFGTDNQAFVRNYSGKVVATLFGNRGNTMRCRFTLADPSAGMSGGGVGECQVSNGVKIDAQIGK